MGQRLITLLAAALVVSACARAPEEAEPIVSLARVGPTALMTLCLELDFNHGRIWN